MAPTVRHNADTRLRASRGAGPVALLALTLAGCVDNSPDAVERSNMLPWNHVPVSSPYAFVRSFEQLCLAPMRDGQAFEPVLRAASYVPSGLPVRGGVRTYLVDDSRPAVAVKDSDAGRSCAVIARARTGQTQRVQEAVARLFPDAAPASPDSVLPGAEQVWIETGEKTRIVFTSRDQNKPRGAQYRLAVTEAD